MCEFEESFYFLNEIEWKPIIINGIESQYLISEYGNIWNKTQNHLLHPCKLQGSGRLHVLLYQNGCRKDYKIHRLVYETFNGPIPKDMTIDHIDENIYNNHYTNLRLLTSSENIKSYLRNHSDHAKIFSDDIIKKFYTLLQNGIYYKEAAKKYNISVDHAYSLMIGRKRHDLWEIYQPFPKSAHCKNAISEKDEKSIIYMIINGEKSRDILKKLDIEYSSINIDKIYKLRKKVGIKDPRFFEVNLIEDVDKLILEGKSNKEIYSILSIQFNSRISDFMARRRRFYNIPNNNCTVGNPEEIKIIKKMIEEGYSNNEILNKINKNKNMYYVNLFGRVRQEQKKKQLKQDQGSSTIENIV